MRTLVSRWKAGLKRGNGADTPAEVGATDPQAGNAAHHEPATFDDYKRRLNGDADLWDISNEWFTRAWR